MALLVVQDAERLMPADTELLLLFKALRSVFSIPQLLLSLLLCEALYQPAVTAWAPERDNVADTCVICNAICCV